VKNLALGIDIGGTNTAFGLVNQAGEILFEHNFRTSLFATPELLIEKIYIELSEKHLLESIVSIGVGAPNGNSLNGTIEYAPNLLWKGIIPIAKLFSEKFNLPCFLENDANAAALGEKKFGRAKNYSDFIVLTLGTGLGSGIFISNQLIVGKHGFAGEFGHIRYRNSDRKCKCGRVGCLETIASATGVKRSFALFAEQKNYSSSLYHPKMNGKVSAFKIFEAAEKNDPLALDIVNYTAQVLGEMIADFAAFSDPESFILFGGIAQSGDFFRSKVETAFKKNALKLYTDRVKIECSELNDKNAAVLGMAAVAFYRS
jgi:glucokinase